MQGGVGAFSKRLVQAMAAQRHELHVITHRMARPPIEGRGFRKLARLQEPVARPWGYVHPLGRRWGWRDVGQIAQVAMRYELDIVNIQYQAAAYNMRSPAINLAPWRLRGLVPTVVTFHDLRVPYLFPKAGRLRRYAVQLMAQKAHGAVVTNAEDEARLGDWGIDAWRIRRIPIGSNIRLHQATEEEVGAARRELGIGEDTFLLGYFGFLNQSKGADLLVEAVASLDDSVHLLFMGGRTGSSDEVNNQALVDRVEAVARDKGVSPRLHWSGYVPDRVLSILFRAVDLIVLPYRDGVSLRRGTLMAALAHGRAIISTEPAQPLPELRHGENIWLVPRNDVAALAEAITCLRRDTALRQRLAAGAKRLGETFSWSGIASRTLAYFGELVSSESAVDGA